MRPEPEAAGTDSHLGRGCGLSPSASIRAQTWLKEGAMPDKGKSKSGGSVKKKKAAKKK